MNISTVTGVIDIDVTADTVKIPTFIHALIAHRRACVDILWTPTNKCTCAYTRCDAHSLTTLHSRLIGKVFPFQLTLFGWQIMSLSVSPEVRDEWHSISGRVAEVVKRSRYRNIESLLGNRLSSDKYMQVCFFSV